MFTCECNRCLNVQFWDMKASSSFSWLWKTSICVGNLGSPTFPACSCHPPALCVCMCVCVCMCCVCVCVCEHKPHWCHLRAAKEHFWSFLAFRYLHFCPGEGRWHWPDSHQSQRCNSCHFLTGKCFSRSRREILSNKGKLPRNEQHATATSSQNWRSRDWDSEFRKH